MIRVLLADDEAMIRAGVRAILSAAPDIEVVAEAGDGREAVEAARSHRPDVALLDIRMPVLDGLSAATELTRAMPETAVIMLTTFSEDEYIAGALEAGVSGFLLKSGDPYELMAAVRAAHQGASYLSPEISHRVIQLVKAYVSTLLGRLGVRNRVQAAVLAHEAGLVDDLEDEPADGG
jgi:DNA-binding NarL/FixJ family response regulator